MEVATYAANIAPPVYSPSVEGAKRDNIARQTIPQPVESQNSAASSQAGSQATTGTSSTLYATSQIVIQEDGKRRQQNGSKNSSKGGNSESSEGKSTAQTAQMQGTQAAARVASGQGTVAETTAQSVAASYSGSAQSAQEEKEIRKTEAVHPSFARYSAKAAQDSGTDAAAQAVSSRYNSIVRSYTPGDNVSLSV
jgi:hypothetical protein